MTEPTNSQTSGTKPPGRAAAWLLLVLGLAVIALAGVRTIGSAEIWTHIALGRDIFYGGIQRTASLTFALPSDTPWVNATWLYDYAVAGIWKVGAAKGAAVMTLIHIAVVLAGFGVLAVRLIRKSGGPAWTVTGALALTAWLMMQKFSPEPALVGLLFTAIFLARASCGSCWKIARVALPVMQVLWTNSHPSFFLGPLIALAFAFDARRKESADETPDVPSRSLFLFAAVLAAATLVNPYGPGLHLWLAKAWMDPARNFTLDPTAAFALDFTVSPLRFAKYAAVALIGGGLLAIRQKLSVAYTAAAVVGSYLLLQPKAYSPLAAALIFPFCVTSLAAISTQFPRLSRLGNPLAAAALTGLGALMYSGMHLGSLGQPSRFGLGFERDVFPADAAQVIASKVAFPPRVLNIAADGGFLATRLRDREIYCDTRVALFGGPFYDRLTRALLGDAKAMREIEAAHNPGAILVNCNWQLAGASVASLKQSGRWALSYFDGTSALLVKNAAEFQQFTRNRPIQQAGLNKLESARQRYEESIGKPGFHANNAQLIGAARVFLALGRATEAEAVYSLLVRGAPNMHSAWVGHGIALTQLGRHTEAVTTLTRATVMRPEDPLPLLWLSLAQHGAGRSAEAKMSEDRARLLNKDYAEGFLENPPVARPSRGP